MSSFIRVAGHRLTSLVRTSTRFCLRIDSGQLAVPTSSTMWVSSSILDAATQRLGKLDGSPTPVPRTTSSRGAAGCPGHWLRRQRTLATARRTFVGGWKVYDYEDKAGTPWTTNPLGFPEQ